MLWAPLLGAGRFGSALGPSALAATSLLPTVAGALVAAVLLSRLLRAFCEFELSLGAAFAVTLGRSLASFAVSLLFVVSFRSAVAPAPALFFLPQILSLVVGYQLLKHLARPVRRLARSGLAQDWLEPQLAAPSTVAGEWNRLLPSVRIGIAQLLAMLERAERAEVPGAVAEALPELEALADRVEEAPPPGEAGRAAQLELVAEIRTLQGALVDLAETAWRGRPPTRARASARPRRDPPRVGAARVSSLGSRPDRPGRRATRSLREPSGASGSRRPPVSAARPGRERRGSRAARPRSAPAGSAAPPRQPKGRAAFGR